MIMLALVCFCFITVRGMQPLVDGQGHALPTSPALTTEKLATEPDPRQKNQNFDNVFKFKVDKGIPQKEDDLKKQEKQLPSYDPLSNATISENFNVLSWLNNMAKDLGYKESNTSVSNNGDSSSTTLETSESNGGKQTILEHNVSDTKTGSVTLGNESLPKTGEGKHISAGEEASVVLKTKTFFTPTQTEKDYFKKQNEGRQEKVLPSHDPLSNATISDNFNVLSWLNNMAKDLGHKESNTSVSNNGDSSSKTLQTSESNGDQTTILEHNLSEKLPGSKHSQISDLVLKNGGMNNQTNSVLVIEESKPVRSCETSPYGSVCTYVLLFSGSLYFQHVLQSFYEISYFSI